ncbi:MAG TPA: hypothetical protein VFD64_08050 [Gemmatimonadaceae bacterium]|nr:hypothetical protein [Gemmatimonadaceae bacterium]
MVAFVIIVTFSKRYLHIRVFRIFSGWFGHLQRSKHLDRGDRRGSAEEREGFPERQAIRIRRVVPGVAGAVVVVIGCFLGAPPRFLCVPPRSKAVSGANPLLPPTQLPEDPHIDGLHFAAGTLHSHSMNKRRSILVFILALRAPGLAAAQPVQ